MTPKEHAMLLAKDRGLVTVREAGRMVDVALKAEREVSKKEVEMLVRKHREEVVDLHAKYLGLQQEQATQWDELKNIVNDGSISNTEAWERIMQLIGQVRGEKK